jgi:succinate dehydrogenase/fumarate reductase flavoprotein subunit
VQETRININGTEIPVVAANTVIVGAGASGMNCAVQLIRFWRQKGVENPQERLLVVTGGLHRGASRMSGSDKQTYYKMGTSPRVPDTAEDFAKTLTAFGCCHGDTALVEGICSLRGFYNLVEAGVPFPHDPFGAFVGYKTDHDPYERATSAGPKTSKFMSECLQGVAERANLRILNGLTVGKLLTRGEGEQRRIVGLLCFDQNAGGEMPVKLILAENYVLAAGGAGEIYATTVYPRGQYGIHGAALEAGLEACNLTESQYGLASIKFRWNVSGTYMQVIPRIYSTDARGGDEREFLTEYFDDMATMATNIFLKGYQWPFDAQRITQHRSSLVDVAVHQETVVRGRRVWMDFLSNPVGAEGWDEFHFSRLGDEAVDYLEKTGATQELPIERLEHMNPPAIEIYAENGIDLTSVPLEIAVCAQHHNGGFSVNKWWESNVPHTFVIGEMAGTHGVKRPGGSALNAGQVGAMRAAEYIANTYGAEVPDASTAAADLQQDVADALARFKSLKRGHKTPDEVMVEIGRRMTRYGAHMRSLNGARKALDEAIAQYRWLSSDGFELSSPGEVGKAARTLQQCLTHAAMLQAIVDLLEDDAGSRGSHCVLAEDGIEMHPKLIDPATGKPYALKPENEALRKVIQTLRYRGEDAMFETGRIEPRPVPKREIAFEPAWTEYREGRIYEV